MRSLIKEATRVTDRANEIQMQIEMIKTLPVSEEEKGKKIAGLNPDL